MTNLVVVLLVFADQATTKRPFIEKHRYKSQPDEELTYSDIGGVPTLAFFILLLYLAANSITEGTMEKNFTIASNFRQQFERSNRTCRSIDWKLVN